MRDFEVRRMFHSIARGYDMQNSVLSLGVDILWRRILARRIPDSRAVVVADIAAGTAEVAMEIARQRPLATVAGIDFTPAMLEVGREKVAKAGLDARVHLGAGDARCLPLPDGCADAVTISFGIRNVEERITALREFHRVLKPGGKLLVMEFSLPGHRVPRFFYTLYFNYILPPVGNLLSRTDYAYSYLMESVHGFPGPEEFSAEIRQADFATVFQTPLTFGIARIHEATKA